LSDRWIEKANNAAEEIKNLPILEINRAINRNSGVWRDHELREALENCMHKKCWYCETRDLRSDNPIDHFRPKNSVFECPDHPGYWWLAFNWRNYRFSCTYCNSRRIDRETGDKGGKHDHFPILNEEQRAMVPTDKIAFERPCLLDPTNANDPRLLFFDQYGRAVPRKNKDKDPIAFYRADKSIELYNLNHGKIRQKRAILYRAIFDAVEKIDVMKSDNSCDVDYAMSNLAKMINEDAEFSAAARIYLMGLRSKNREWLEELLETG
jgi:uncharacterized protein (TIGR02646 family)